MSYVFSQLIIVAVLLAASCVPGFGQGIVWNSVPNQQQGGEFPDPTGNPVYASPFNTISSISVDMNGDGTVDFEFQAVSIGAPTVQVLPQGANAVLSITVPPPDIGQIAVALNSSDQVNSLAPVGTVWAQRIDAPPFPIGSYLIAGIQEYGFSGQFIDQRHYVGVQFSAADGIHYGALDVGGSSEGNLVGFLYGYGYNPTPGAPFDLSLIPVPEPSTWTLLGLGMVMLWRKDRRR